LLLPFLTVASPAQPAEPVRIAVVADTNISSHPTEVRLNFGASPRIRLKGIEMWMLMMPDRDALRGRRIASAVLRLHPAGPVRLRTLGFSTVATPWLEGTGAGTESRDGATFHSPDGRDARWCAERAGDFTGAAFTVGGTRMAFADIRGAPDGWIEAEVPADLLEEVALGRSHGLAVTDEKGQTYANNDVHSREQSGYAPYLLVSFGPGESLPPAAQGAPKTPAQQSRRSVTLPPAPVGWLAPAGELAPALETDRLRVWAVEDLRKVDPLTGGDIGAGGARPKASPIWDGRRVLLQAARNEFVAFQLIVERRTDAPLEFQVELEPLAGHGGARLDSGWSQVGRVWYVRDGRWCGEVVVPTGDVLRIPDERNGVPQQRNQAVWVDLYVPHQARPGDYAGRVRVTPAGGRAVSVPISLRVLPLLLPDTLGFEVDLNAYGPPGDAETELRFHRMAHAHRATLNILGYNQAGVANPDYVPRTEGVGPGLRVTDWSGYDARHGRYFDGSAFRDMPRRGVPVTHAYLPLHEGWPSSIRDHYAFRPSTAAYPECVAEHALLAPSIEQAFSAAFAEAFRAASREFARHIAAKGWSRTRFHFYLNNKYYFRDPAQGGRGSSWWLLDEPMHRDDWLALRWFGGLFRDGVRSASPNGQVPANLLFRADISRPQWQRDWLDGLVDLMCVSGELLRYNERCRDMQRRWGVRFWHYGEANALRDPNERGAAWCLAALAMGADGVLPWNSLGGDGSFEKPTPTTLLYPGDRFGIRGPLASLRLKALRRGQQDAEYLLLLAGTAGWGRARVEEALRSIPWLAGRQAQRFAEDAGTLQVDPPNPHALAEIRAAVAAALERAAMRSGRPTSGPAPRPRAARGGSAQRSGSR